jgi:hypothetical protein
MLTFRRLQYGDPERRAFEAVLEAVEEAIDADDLESNHRAILAEIHDRLEWSIGRSSPTYELAVALASCDEASAGPASSKAAREGATNRQCAADFRGRHSRYYQLWMEESARRRDLIARMIAGPGGTGRAGLSSATVWYLRKVELLTIEEIAALTDAELLAIDGIGPTRLAEIRAALIETS